MNMSNEQMHWMVKVFQPEKTVASLPGGASLTEDARAALLGLDPAYYSVEIARLAKGAKSAARTLLANPQVATMVERYAYMNQCVVVGRGLNYANAYEFAIKLMETCYVVAERFSGADFLHGPIAMVDRGFPAFLFAPPGPTLKGQLELLSKLNSLGAETVVISSEAAAVKAATRALKIPQRINELLTPIPYVIPAQLFAALLAEAKGLSPDQPRSLAKVTQTV